MTALATRLEDLGLAPELERELPGGPELPLVAPTSVEGFREVLALARAERLCVVPRGLGSRSDWYAPAAKADLVLSTREWKGVTDHQPADGTLTAKAGSTMAELSERAAAGGHHLTPAAPHAERCTLGGTLAAGASGPDRMRYGPVRHHVLGLSCLLADGSLTKSGGKLVKNVTGYDLHRLYTGSHGTLCLILEASLRLFPLPEVQHTWRVETAGRDAALALARELRALAAPFTSMCLAQQSNTPWTLELELAGRPEPVRDAVPKVDALLQGLNRPAPEPRALAGPELHLSMRPSRLTAAVDAALAQLAGIARVELDPGVATATLTTTGIVDAERLVQAAEAARTLGASAHWRGLHAVSEVPRFGEPRGGLGLMRRLRDALDPTGVFARGRFTGGL